MKFESMIGIYLGISFCCIAIMKNDKVEMISDNSSEGNKLPSIIYFTKIMCWLEN